MKAGDVVQKINGEKVEDAAGFIRIVGNMKPGEVVKLQLIRDGKKKKVSVTLGERPSEDSLKRGNFHSESEALKDQGITVSKSAEGIVIEEISPDSDYQQILQPGDVIESINRHRVKKVGDVERLLTEAQKTKSKGVVFVIRRDGVQMLVSLRLK